MKHATAKTLKSIEPLLKDIRRLLQKEKKIGIFYKGSGAYLHFHEDKKGIFADVKVNNKWIRIKIPQNKKVWKRFVKKLLPP